MLKNFPFKLSFGTPKRVFHRVFHSPVENSGKLKVKL
jgi:hypothetical protein